MLGGESTVLGVFYINHAKAVRSLETVFLEEKEITNKKKGELLEKAKRFCKSLASLFLSVKHVLFQLKKKNPVFKENQIHYKELTSTLIRLTQPVTQNAFQSCF